MSTVVAYTKCISTHCCALQNMKQNFFIFTLEFSYNYIKHHDIPLFSMTRSVAAQKKCIIKMIVSVYNIFLHLNNYFL